MLKLVSWNVNGLRAVVKKDPSFAEYSRSNSTPTSLPCRKRSCRKDKSSSIFPGYTQTWSYAERKGYSGTAVFSREEPLSGRRADESPHAHDLAAERRGARVRARVPERIWFVDVYTPNAKNELARLDERHEPGTTRTGRSSRGLTQQTNRWSPAATSTSRTRKSTSRTPSPTVATPVFRTRSAASFTELLLDAGFTDTFRALHPDATGAYSWWSYRFNARKNNAGWRIDYFLVSDDVADRVARREHPQRRLWQRPLSRRAADRPVGPGSRYGRSERKRSALEHATSSSGKSTDSRSFLVFA